MGAALVAFPGVARATGGREIGGPVQEPAVRILLASGANIPPPKQLDAWYFAWNGRTYRGGFTFVPLPSGRQGLIDVVPLDSYLYGVVSTEVSPAWPSEALKAQAILARTYVTTKLHADKPYDVVATDSDQHYGGIEGESVQGRAAVDATAGTVVTYAKAPAHVFFSACCGGRTADSADVWGSSIPYLRSFADPHCAGTPEFRWEARVAYGDVQRRFDLARAGAIRSVQLRDLGSSGRPKELAFAGSAATIGVSTDAFRSAAGHAVIRSTFLRGVTPAGDDLVVTGNGFGHGVGMCQWGAREMAAAGASAADIIAFYFPKTALG
jgi:stage II sporulation protein D